jgi:hypothetical protein
MVGAVLVLSSFGCTKNDDELDTIDLDEDNVIMSEDYWVSPEGIKLIALEGFLYIEFQAGAVTESTLITIASVAIDNEPMEWYNTMDQGISITSTSQDLDFRDLVTIRMNYVPEEFQKTTELNEKNLTIYELNDVGTLKEGQVSIGECCVDYSCMTVEGCICECGIYVIGELYVVNEVR